MTRLVTDNSVFIQNMTEAVLNMTVFNLYMTYYQLECMAGYSGQLLAPAEGFGL